jgi:hypothetical protein
MIARWNEKHRSFVTRDAPIVMLPFLLCFVDVSTRCQALTFPNHVADLMNTGIRYPSNNFSYVCVFDVATSEQDYFSTGRYTPLSVQASNLC